MSNIPKYIQISLIYFEIFSNIFKYPQISRDNPAGLAKLSSGYVGMFADIWGYLKCPQMFSDILKYLQVSRDNPAGLAKLSSGYLKIFEYI